MCIQCTATWKKAVLKAIKRGKKGVKKMATSKVEALPANCIKELVVSKNIKLVEGDIVRDLCITLSDSSSTENAGLEISYSFKGKNYMFEINLAKGKLV